MPVVIRAAACFALFGAASCRQLAGLDDHDPIGDGEPKSAQPPVPPADAPAGDGPGYAFVVRRLFLGDTDRNGAPSSNAWKQYGYDIDGRVSGEDSPGLCVPAAGASADVVYPDGTAGIDNAFGKLLLPIITGIATDATVLVNQAIAQGESSFLIQIDGLGFQDEYLGLNSRWLVASALGGTPLFDGSDTWPVTSESSSTPNAFAASYVSDGIWVSNPRGSVSLSLSLSGYTLALALKHATLTMELSADRLVGSNGVISGVMVTEDFIGAMRSSAGSFSPELCEGTTFDAVASQLRQASDIMFDGSQNAGLTCDGISVGMGFEAVAVQIGPVAAPVPAPIDPCMPPP